MNHEFFTETHPLKFPPTEMPLKKEKKHVFHIIWNLFPKILLTTHLQLLHWALVKAVAIYYESEMLDLINNVQDLKLRT